MVTLERDRGGLPRRAGFWTAPASPPAWISWRATRSRRSRRSRVFDLLFVDAAKDEYARYIELADEKLSERALLVVDNLLMFGEVALAPDADTFWRPAALASARALNAELLSSERWLGSLLPVGDGVGLAARTP